MGDRGGPRAASIGDGGGPRAASIADACALLAETPLAVAVVALRLLTPDPVAPLRALRAARPDLALVVVADSASPDDAALFRAGVHEIIDAAGLRAGALEAVIQASMARARAQIDSARTARQLELLHGNASEGYLVVDLGGRILAAGDGPAPDARGTGLPTSDAFDLVVHAERARVRSIFDRVARQHGERAELETEVVGRGGNRRWMEVSLTNLAHEDSIGGILVNYWDITRRRVAEQALAFNAAVLGAVGQAIIATDASGRIAYWNQAASDLYGWSPAEVAGRLVHEILEPARSDETAAIRRRIAEGKSWSGEEWLSRRGGIRLPVWTTATPMFDDAGNLVAIISATADLTERRQADAGLRRLSAIVDSSTDAIVSETMAGIITTWNRGAERLYGYRADEAVGRHISLVVPNAGRADLQALLANVAAGVEIEQLEAVRRKKGGEEVTVLLSVSPLLDDRGRLIGASTVTHDITERKALERELEHRALHDDLTGLPNRALLNDRLDHALVASARTGSRTGVAMLDVDGFKLVNDALGHTAGDVLLVEVGHRLRATVRPADTVARFGGDEFVVVCEQVTVDAMTTMVARIIDAMTQPFVIEGREIALHASVGITISRQASTSQSLLSEADAAMYRAKELGRSRSAVFDDSMRTRAAALLEGSRALGLAIANRELVPYFQPIIDMATGHTVGVEALARWHQPDGRVILPSHFIPLAETSGLVVDLGELIMAQGAERVARWNAAPGRTDPLWVSVNLSARQLIDTRLDEVVAAILAECGLPPDLLHLEITETVVMQDISHAVQTLERLRRLGVHLAVDDFGTGYSSLAYLKQLPVDTLKIDRSFIRGVATSSDDASIVKAVLSLGGALGLRCVAEGVETAEQRAALMALGCQLGQGYLWSRPLAPADADAWAERQRRSDLAVGSHQSN